MASTGVNPVSTSNSILRSSPNPGTTPPYPVGSHPAISNPPAATKARSKRCSSTEAFPVWVLGHDRTRRQVFVGAPSESALRAPRSRSIGGRSGPKVSNIASVEAMARWWATRSRIIPCTSGPLHRPSPCIASRASLGGTPRASCRNRTPSPRQSVLQVIDAQRSGFAETDGAEVAGDL